MRKAAGSLLLTAVAAGTMTGLAAPSADAAPQAKDPYAHVRLERVWAARTGLSMGGSTKQNAQLTVGKCSSDKSQRWELGGSLIWSEAHNGKVIASNSTKAGSHPYLEKAGSSNPARGRQEWDLS
ncbi:hypothetical protein GTY41_43775 [Streptomyces sp. SID685]|uniref:hypothetical protein n=1 Tax=Streptomyces TaxID=1883 RepID=UPI00136E1D8D|nr:hypothetical protein [Streptomyces sp. SID685]MYR91652.1 hypothetical protein [Streptomyces sp. SID685]